MASTTEIKFISHQSQTFHELSKCQARKHAARVGFVTLAYSIMSLAAILFYGIMKVITCGCKYKNANFKGAFHYIGNLMSITKHSFYTVFSPGKGLENKQYEIMFYHTYRGSINFFSTQFETFAKQWDRNSI